MTTTTQPESKSNTSTAAAKKKPTAATKAKPGTDPTAAKLMQLIARQWAAQLRAIAEAVGSDGADIPALRRRTQRVVDAMREAEKVVGQSSAGQR